MGKCGHDKTGIAGFSLIEVMIGGGLLAFIAIAVLPAVFSISDTAKPQGFKALCTGVVRAKLQEYLNGVADNTLGTSYKPTGFEYTKNRYQSTSYGYDNCSLNPNPATPGFREAVYSNSLQSGQEYVPSTTTPAVMQGFQLYVMIRHYNPRVFTNGQPTRACPHRDYQFYSLGDALEVTVTGMVRTSTAVSAGGRGGAAVGKIKDIGSAPNPILTCSATELIYPPRLPFRYYLGNDGRIRNYLASIAFASSAVSSSREAMESHFRSVWIQSETNNIDTSSPISNIRSFAVSPDNQWVYILRPGELARFGPCYDQQTSVVVGGVATLIGGNLSLTNSSVGAPTYSFKGIPDCPRRPSINSIGTNPGPDSLVWTVPENIENITVDFGSSLSSPTDDKVYAMVNSGSVASATNMGVLVATLPTVAVGGVYPATFAESTNFYMPNDRPRIRGIFIAQTFPSVTTPTLFYFDNTCFNGDTSTSDVSKLTYCATIFNAYDSTMGQEMRELPMQVESISY